MGAGETTNPIAQTNNTWVNPEYDQSVFVSGCELNQIVDNAGACPTDSDGLDKVLEQSEKFLELITTSGKKDGADNSDKTDNESVLSFVRGIFQSIANASSGRDYCRFRAQSSIGQVFGKDGECKDKPGYELKSGVMSAILTDGPMLCYSYMPSLVEAIKEENLPACINQVFAEQQRKTEISENKPSQEDLSQFQHLAKGCLGAMMWRWNGDTEHFELQHSTQQTNNPMFGGNTETVMDLEWICAGSLFPVLTKEEQQQMVGLFNKRTTTTYPWDPQPNSKGPSRAVENMGECFDKHLYRVKFNRHTTIYNQCLKTTDDVPLAKIIEWGVPGSALAFGRYIIRFGVKIVGTVLALALGKEAVQGLKEKIGVLGDKLKGLGKKLKKKIAKKFAKPDADEKPAAGDAPAKMVALDPNAKKLLAPQPVFRPAPAFNPIPALQPSYATSWSTAIDHANWGKPMLEPWQYYTIGGFIAVATLGLAWEVGMGVAALGEVAATGTAAVPVFVK